MSEFSRRRLMKAGITVGGAGLAFSSLAARAANGRGAGDGYGPLSPKADLSTGLPLLALPDGFEYMSYGWTGQIMADGRPTPADPDGMAVCGKRRNVISLVRNHELSTGEGTQCLVLGGMYNMNEFGGTTTLFFDVRRGRFTDSYTSLGGTLRNCAGGPTPWNSWISCEETFHAWNDRSDGFNHGYVFEVPAFGISNGRPVRAAGRFSHEAVAFDPMTGVMYETEDTGISGFYKYVQPGAGGADWGAERDDDGGSEMLRDGGQLSAMVVNGVTRKDMINRSGELSVGDYFTVSWQPVRDPEAIKGRAFDSAPDAAVFSRGEGCWEDAGQIYFVSADGGPARLGQVWVYYPAAEILSLLYESEDLNDLDGPDNIAVSPRGGIILCEDGGSTPKRLIGLGPDGVTYPFAENQVDLETGDIDIIDSAFPGFKANFRDNPDGDYRSREWCGATFYQDWLFANIHSPGMTFAIRGPWKRGSL